MTKARVLAISGDKHYLAMRVVCVELQKEFSTATEAVKFVGLKHPTTICKCLKGTRKTAGGYHWEIA